MSGFSELLLKICGCAKNLGDFLPILPVSRPKCQIYLTYQEKNKSFSSQKWKFLAITLKILTEAWV